MVVKRGAGIVVDKYLLSGGDGNNLLGFSVSVRLSSGERLRLAETSPRRRLTEVRGDMTEVWRSTF